MSYSVALWRAVANRAKDLIYAPGEDPADVPTLTVLSSAGQTLAVIDLDPAHATVTNDAALKIGIMDAGNATADGTAASVLVKDADGTAHIGLPCLAGTEPVAGSCVLNTLAISAGALVTIMDLTIPAGDKL